MAEKNSIPRYYPPGKPRTDDLVRAYDLIYQLTDKLASSAAGNTSTTNTTNISVITGGGGGEGGGNSVVAGDLVDVFYPSSNNNITIPIPASAPLGYVVVIVQPANGNGGIIWGAGFLAASNSIDQSNNSISTFRFVPGTVNGVSGYIMQGQPTTGMNLT